MHDSLSSAKLIRSQPKSLGSKPDRDIILSEWSGGDGWCLGHAYDGLLWGRLLQGVLRFSSDFQADWGAQFRIETLTDLRLFNEQVELRLWLTSSGFQSCRIEEGSAGENYKTKDTQYVLIHRPENIHKTKDAEFVGLEGTAGQRHYPPGNPVPEKLAVRTYYKPDETGILRVFEHRALKLVGRKCIDA